MKGNRAAVYARISEDRGGDELGVTRQLRDCRKLCMERGFAIASEYVDNDISATTGRRRPSYDRMLADVESGGVDVVVAWHADRLYRRPDDLEAFITVIEGAGATVATVRAGDMDLGTASGRMVARMLGAAARHEVEMKGERQEAKHREIAEAGRPTSGGTRPFGFDTDRITIRREEATEIGAAAKRILGGASLRGVVTDWNRRGISTPTGGKWTLNTVRRLLMSARIAGLRSHKGAVVAKAIWKPIVTKADHERLVAILGDPSRRTTTNTARTYMLSGGLVTCGRCDAALVGRAKAPGRRRYVCSVDHGGCNQTFVMAEPLEAFVADAVVEALDGPGLRRARRRVSSTRPEERRAADELAAVRARITELADAYAKGTIGLEAFGDATRKLEARRDELRTKVAEATPRVVDDLPAGAGALWSWWEQAHLESRRELVAIVLTDVVVGPGLPGRTTFDPARIELRWRV